MAFNLLIVDDSLPMRALIKKIVKASGFDVGEYYQAGNGKEALKILNENWIDLVLTDYNMPEMDGLELLEAMQASETLRDLPVIIVSTEGSEERIQEFMEKGASGYIKKPFEPEEIKQNLNQVMGEPTNEPRESDQSFEGSDF